MSPRHALLDRLQSPFTPLEDSLKPIEVRGGIVTKHIQEKSVAVTTFGAEYVVPLCRKLSANLTLQLSHGKYTAVAEPALGGGT